MSKDTFKRTAPTIQFFKDGETVRVKKLGKMMEKIQDGMASLEVAVGDIHNRAILFEASPLFQNSIGRSVGQMDELTVFAANDFAAIRKTKSSLHQGLIHWPQSSEVARVAGSRSMNLLPVVNQLDKVGIGCIRDDGNRCAAGYQTIYDKEKNIIKDASLLQEYFLSGWVHGSGGGTTTDTTRHVSGTIGGAQMDIAYRYNMLPYSENFELWTIPGSITNVQRISALDPNGQSATYQITPLDNSNGLVDLVLSGSGALTSSNWCFSVWAAASGSRNVSISISGQSLTSRTVANGSLEGGIVYNWYVGLGNEYNSLEIPLSGTEWKRYWIHANYPSAVAASGIRPQIILNLSGLSDTTPLYIFGAQLEPTNFPTTYRRTQGAVTSGLGSEVSLAYNLSVIPGHTYQVTMEGSGSIQCRIDGSTLFTLTSSRGADTFLAETENIYIDAYISGTTLSTNYLTLFRIDPGTPCHAMSCPGLSAYDKVRSYRAVLPPITESGNQNFSERLQLPEEFEEAISNELPGNILGVFDHELNHAVPDRIVDWKLANWPIGGLELGGSLSDPDFLTDWTTSLGDTYPSELTPTGTSGVTTRDKAITSIVSTDTLPPDPSPHLLFVGSSAGRQGAISPPADPGFPLNSSLSAVTAETFVKLQSVGCTPYFKLMGSNAGSGSGGLGKTMCSGGLLRHTIYSNYYGMTSTATYGTRDIRDDQWHHIAVVQTHNGAVYTSKLYIDGTLDSTNTTAGSWYAYDTLQNPLAHFNFGYDNDIGVTSSSGYRVAGCLIREGAKYTTNFTAPGALIPSGLSATNLSGIIIHWPMSEGVGQELIGLGVSGYRGGLGVDSTNPDAADPTWVTSGTRTYLDHFANTDYYEALAVMPSGQGNYSWNQSFTMEGWFRVGDGITTGASNAIAFQRSNTIGGNVYTNYLLGMNNGRWYSMVQTFNGAGAGLRVRAGYATVAGRESINSGVVSDDGLFHHVAFTITKNSGLYNPMKLFVDGVIVASGQSEFQTNWDWSIPSGETDVFSKTAPSGMLVQVGSNTPNLAVDEILVVSGIKYTGGGFVPTTPLLAPYSGVILAHLRFNEGQGNTAYNYNENFQPPLILRNLNTAGYPAVAIGTDWRWRSDNFYTTVSTSGTPIDRVTVSVSGYNQKALEHEFVLAPGRTYTWTYNVRADLSYSGIFETYRTISGVAEVDLLLDNSFQAIATTVENKYRVSVTEPGSEAWAEENPGNFWTIKRRLRTTLDNSIIKLTVGVSGNVSAQSATFDSMDLLSNIGNSTMFKYSCDPVLGLNWEGSARHIIEENLFPWSTHIEFGNLNDLSTFRFERNIPDPSGNLTAIKIMNNIFGHEWDGAAYTDAFVDNQVTFQWWARSNNPDMSVYTAYLEFALGASQVFEHEVTSDWQQFSRTFNVNVAGNTVADFEIYLPDPGFEMEVAWFSIHNGSGIVDYVPTNGKIDRRYKKAVRVKQASQLKSYWTDAYGLVGGAAIQTTLTSGTVNGLLFETNPLSTNFANFPDSGVIRIAGQEIAHRGKYTDGRFIDCVPAWRGTDVDITYLTSGEVVTYVPLPQAIDRIEDDIVWFKEDLPLAHGDWANQFSMQIYNTQISNLDRFSLTASAVPLSRAAGTLMTAFMDHVADDARHFRRDQLCAALVDPSIYAGFDDMEVRLELVHSQVTELDQPAILNIFAFGFMKPNPKTITITWGDGSETVITETGQYFEPVSHTYDLGAGNTTEQHTITVDVFDNNLHVVRSNSIRILVDPTTKGSQTVRAYIITQPALVQQSRTNIL